MERRRVRRRAMALSMIAVLLLVVACGRATEQQIEQALGITPVPTADPAESTRASDAASADASTPADENAGVATLGRSKFQFSCQTCHSVSGSAPDLLATGGIGTDIDYATLYPILREGEGHSPSPGPYETFELTDADIANIGAYIREQAAP